MIDLNVLNGMDDDEIEERLARYRRQLAKVTAEIKTEQEYEERIDLVSSAKDKLQRLIMTTLTNEELAAVTGMYLFIHGTCFDIVRKAPSATDKGQGGKFQTVLEEAEA